MELSNLVEKAIEAKSKAYAPYSNFPVGAALVTENNKIYLGANVENASYGLTVCAERIAAFKAVLEGEKKFKAIAIAGITDDFLPPCGACRQVLLELCGKDIDVILINSKKETRIYKLNQLIPFSFGDDHLR